MSKHTLDVAAEQLDRVLDFFSRVETKASFLFAVNTSIVGITALNLQPDDFEVWYVIVPAIVTVLLNGGAFFFLYRCAYPSLDGGERSLIYFREIAKLREADFIASFEKLTEEEVAKDLLGQVWRNSKILAAKFDALKVAFVLTAISLLPWVIHLAAASTLHAQLPTLR